MRTGYRCGAARVAVESDDADVLRWLDEFVVPWFEPCVPGAADRVIRYESSSAACETFAGDLARMPAQKLLVFALDSDVVTLAGGADGGVALANDPDLGAHYRVTSERIDVVAEPANPRARVALMRVVREVLVNAAQDAAPRLDLHAAAVATAAGAVLLAGPKRAGKTTLLAQLVAEGAAGLIANDRVLVDVESTPPVAAGVPTLVAIRPGTLALYPRLRRSTDERPAILHSRETPDRVGDAYEGAAAARDFSLTPAQFAQRSAARTVGAAPVAAIVFPEIDPRLTGRALVALALEDGLARLLAARYGARSANRPGTIFEAASGVRDGAPERSADQALRLAAAVPMYGCVLGTGASGESAAGLLRAVGIASAPAERAR